MESNIAFNSSFPAETRAGTAQITSEDHRAFSKCVVKTYSHQVIIFRGIAFEHVDGADFFLQ